MATIKDVASKAKVSVATVSNVICGTVSVGPAAREPVVVVGLTVMTVLGGDDPGRPSGRNDHNRRHAAIKATASSAFSSGDGVRLVSFLFRTVAIVSLSINPFWCYFDGHARF